MLGCHGWSLLGNFPASFRIHIFFVCWILVVVGWVEDSRWCGRMHVAWDIAGGSCLLLLVMLFLHCAAVFLVSLTLVHVAVTASSGRTSREHRESHDGGEVSAEGVVPTSRVRPHFLDTGAGIFSVWSPKPASMDDGTLSALHQPGWMFDNVAACV